jgi:hypothetical protein
MFATFSRAIGSPSVCFVDNTANYNTLVYLNYPCPTVADITLPSAASSSSTSLLANDLSGLNSTDAVPVFRLSLKSAALPPCYAVSSPTGVRTAYFRAPIAQSSSGAANLYVQTSSANMTGVAFPSTTAEVYIYPFMYAGTSTSANPATFTLTDAAGVMTLSCLFTPPTGPNVFTSPMQVAISITSYVPTASPPHSGGGAGSSSRASSSTRASSTHASSTHASSTHASSSHAHGQSQSHVDSSSVVVAPSNRATNAQSKLSTGAIAGIVAGVVVVVVLVIGVVMWRTSVSKKEKRRLTPSTSTS